MSPQAKKAGQAVVSAIETEIIKTIGDQKLPTAEILKAIDRPQSNTRNNLSRMAAKGYLELYTENNNPEDPLTRDIYNERLWYVTDLGHIAVELYNGVMEAQAETYRVQGETDSTRPDQIRRQLRGRK